VRGGLGVSVGLYGSCRGVRGCLIWGEAGGEGVRQGWDAAGRGAAKLLSLLHAWPGFMASRTTSKSTRHLPGHFEAQPSHLLWALLHHCPPLGGGSIAASVSLANPLAHARAAAPVLHAPRPLGSGGCLRLSLMGVLCVLRALFWFE